MKSLWFNVIVSLVLLAGVLVFAAPARAEIQPGALNDGIASILYVPASGHLVIYSGDDSLDGLKLDSAGGLFLSGNANLPSSEDYAIQAADDELLGALSLEWSGSTGSLLETGYDLGQVLPPQLTKTDVMADLTFSYSIWGLYDQTQTGDLLYGYAGDANLDGTVSFADFLSLQGGFGDQGLWTDGDFNGDRTVSFADFLILQGNFGTTYPDPPGSIEGQVLVVPEPATMSLLAIGGLAGVLRKKK